jgi:Fur family ferric uptake transcriptional regulator
MATDHDQTLHSTLRAKGYRLTPQRQLVLQAVTTLRHGTPEEICLEVQRSAGGVNISTVYRTLELLEELGLVTHAHLGHGPPTYHAATDEDHLHLVCRYCATVIETDRAVTDDLVRELASRHGFQTDVAHFAIYGTCQGCAAHTPEDLSLPGAVPREPA